MNLTVKPRALYRGTRIGEAHVITKCDRVECMLPTIPRDSGESEDSDNEGWLRDGRVKYQPAATLQGRATFRPARIDVRMDPADLPEYLQPLMEEVARRFN